MVDDKRLYERYRIEIDVAFEFGGERIVARSRDISLGGMFVETDRRMPYGTVLPIELRLPSLQAPAVIHATVRWIGTDGVGVQFGTLRAKETWAINQLVRR